jgi:hypothetical protein
MGASKILVRAEGKGRASLAPAPETGWSLLGGVGWLFTVVAAADLVLAWYPAGFGNAEWEFGTATTSLEHLPLLAVGMALVFGSAVARGSKGTLKGISVLLVLLALAIIGAGLLLGRNIGAATAAVTDPIIRVGLNRSILQSLVQAVLYPVAFGWLGIKGWNHARTA